MLLGNAGRSVFLPALALALVACSSVPDGGGTVSFRTEWSDATASNEYLDGFAAAPSGDLVVSGWSYDADGMTPSHVRKRADDIERWKLATAGYNPAQIAVGGDDAVYVLTQIFNPETVLKPVYGTKVSPKAFPANVLLKLGSSGEVLWSKVYDEGRAAYPTAFTADEHGVYLGGTYATSFTLDDAALTPSGSGGVAAFLAHVDPEGNVVSARSYGSNLNLASISALVPNPDGTTVVAGFFAGTLNFGGTPMAAAGSAIFFAKLDAAGDAVWTHHYVGNGRVMLARWADDYALVIGGGPTDLGRGEWYSGHALARLGADGGIRWVKTLDYANYGVDDSREVTTTPSGHALLSTLVPDGAAGPNDYGPPGYSRALLAIDGSGSIAGTLDLGRVEPGQYPRTTRIAAARRGDVYVSTSAEQYGGNVPFYNTTLRRLTLDVSYAE
jgi:hypothetical protein